MKTTDDLDLAVGLLRAAPTHENRTEAQLRGWAVTALGFGDELAAEPDSGEPPDVVERDGGVRDGVLTLAEYDPRRGTVIVYTDGLSRAAEVFARRGWTVPPDALRAAAVAHETAHRRLHGPAGRELTRRLDHPAARIGRWRWRGHVVGADELVAHRFAHRRSGLDRSPLLLTAALAQSTFGG